MPYKDQEKSEKICGGREDLGCKGKKRKTKWQI